MSGSQRVLVVELLSRTSNGDRSAFRALYAHAGSGLFALCLRMMRNREEAEEVLQEAFVKIWERSYLFDPARGDGLAWMAAIARNCALDRLRKPGRDSLPFDEAAVAEVESRVERLDEATGADLKRCLHAMRREYRNAVVLAFVNGMTHEELAVSLGKPVGTIKSWLRRGLEQLKGCMDA
jgi:RNA polymerase sigma-70 factor (ECF subfamily)